MTIIKPREYQGKVISDTEEAWVSFRNVLAVAPTGAGKTFIKAFMAKKFYDKQEYVVIFAHRDVLLSQISMSLANIGLPHKFICAAATEKEVSNLHVQEFGHSYRDETSTVIVASVLTWINRDVSDLAEHIKCWMLDEAHHLTVDTSWHKCIQPLVNAKGMGVTATPLRADKKPLGIVRTVKMFKKSDKYQAFIDEGWTDKLIVEHGYGEIIESGGIFEEMVLAPTMGELIEMGSLSPYRIYTVPSNLDISSVNVTGGGDYNQKKLAAASDKADITGDAVEHYKRLSYGKQAMTFCVSIEHAKHVSKQFNDAGISAVALSSKSKLAYRQRVVKEFKQGKITNLVSCDLFGEGFDCPACTTVIMLRKTMSYGLFMQQFGRMLRVFEGKDYGILLDHVGNVAEHCIYGAPHDSPEWSLTPDKKPKKKVSDEKGINFRTCPKCHGYYSPKSNNPADFNCPYCGHRETDEEINDAAKEIQVREGTLVEHDNSYVLGLIKQRENIDLPVERVKQKHHFSPPVVKFSAAKNHLKRQEAQRQLREWIESWCSHIAAQKHLDVETTQNEFTRVHGVDVFQAQVLGAREATDLLNKIKTNWSDHITGITVV